MHSTSSPQNAAVIGGGLTGLVSALRLANGGCSVTLYEGAARMSGKIQSKDGVDYGAEFIDTTQTEMINLCKEENITLIPSKLGDERFALPDGRMLDAETYYAAIRPIQEKIIRDKAAIASAPGGERARHLDGMGLDAYLKELAGRPVDSAQTNFWDKLRNLATRATRVFHKSGRVSDGVLAAMGAAYMSEAGQDKNRISALQYVNEASAQLGATFASDYGYRVEGGMEALTNAVKKRVEEKGGMIRTNMPVTGVARNEDGKYTLTFADGQTANGADRVVLALPAHKLAEMSGLEALGMPSDAIDTLKSVQYTHNAKFSVALKEPGANQCLFFPSGFQTWNAPGNRVTFLAGGDVLTGMRAKDLVLKCLKDYAKASGSTVDKMFDLDSLEFRGPDKVNPCYPSPAPGQVQKLQKLAQVADAMAEKGLGIAGNYFPAPVPGNASIGFMDCGVSSADRATAIMASKDALLVKALEQARGIVPQKATDGASASNDGLRETQAPSRPVHPAGFADRLTRSEAQANSAAHIR